VPENKLRWLPGPLLARSGKRSPALVLCILGGLLACILAPTAALGAGETAALRADLSHQLTLAGPASGAYVYDLTANQALFSERATTPRPPASVEKLYTASTALALMGAAARLTTTVLGVGRLAPGGVWEGSLYLRGGGDPTFGSASFIHNAYNGTGASVSTLVSQLVAVDGIHHITGSIEGDESYLDSRRGEPSSGYGPDPFLEGTLSGLAFDRGASGSAGGPHAPAAYAAGKLWAALKAHGVTIRGSHGAAPAPAGAALLAQVQSPTVAELLGLMLPPSDNFFAETLLKDLGARFAGAGTTAAGASIITRTIVTLFGVHPRVLDGSGLSAADRTSPLQVAQLLLRLASTPAGAVLRANLAVAGHSGTLRKRMRGTRAAGRCQAKTGTLTGVSNLAGYCESGDGHLLAFAIFTDAIAIEAAHTIQDHMAITLASSNIGPAARASTTGWGTRLFRGREDRV
jgi:D-alanyl-D-alanine carboxypeptidase/D-alanyl-D-alanine-endopeptidase (penicillin-binding protein 4)